MPAVSRIGLDLDGVIIDHTENKLRLAQERGFELEPWQTNSNVMDQYVPDDDYREIRDHLYREITTDAAPVVGALETIAEISDELYIISARRLPTVRYAQDWLDRHRIYDYIPAERIFFCSDETEKRQHCQRLGIQLYLDDKLKVLNLLPYYVRRTLLDHHGLADKLRPADEIKVVSDWLGFRKLINGR